MRTPISLALLAGLTVVFCAPSWARTWNDKSGRFSIEADFVKLESGEVSLKTPDGTTVDIAFDRLSDSDRKYVKAQAKQNGRHAPMTKDEAAKHCSPQAVDIEIIGRDAQGKFMSQGAGSILHEDGYVLTCEHITVDGFSQKVFLADGSSHDFKLLGRAGGTFDLAVMRFKPDRTVPAITLGRSTEVQKDEPTMVIGNPSGRKHTITYGVINQVECGGGTQFEVAQAGIGPGDSGGPVFNLRGEQIGLVHVKIFTLHNISRHIRIDHLRKGFADVFMNEDRYPYTIGIAVDCYGEEATVTSVKSDSPAARAGIREGDVITQFDTMRIGNGLHYVLALMDRVTGEPVTLTLERDGRTLEKQVQPKKRQS